MFVITYNLLTLKNTQGDKVQNEANNEKSQEQGGSAGVRGGHPGSDTAVIADVAPPPAVEINGIVRKLAKTAQRPKPLARPELKIVTPGKELPVPPSAMSLRAKCPPVLDQDPIESCAAFAFTSALRFLHLRDGLDEPLSPLFCYYATRVLTEGEQTSDDSGCKADAVVETLEKFGACVESAWPYDTSKFSITPPTTAFDDAATRKLTKAYRVTTLRAMKVSIADGYPVPVAFPLRDPLAMATTLFFRLHGALAVSRYRPPHLVMQLQVRQVVQLVLAVAQGEQPDERLAPVEVLLVHRALQLVMPVAR